MQSLAKLLALLCPNLWLSKGNELALWVLWKIAICRYGLLGSSLGLLQLWLTGVGLRSSSLARGLGVKNSSIDFSNIYCSRSVLSNVRLNNVRLNRGTRLRRLGENLSQKLELEFCRFSKVNSWNIPVESDGHLVGR